MPNIQELENIYQVLLKMQADKIKTEREQKELTRTAQAESSYIANLFPGAPQIPSGIYGQQRGLLPKLLEKFAFPDTTKGLPTSADTLWGKKLGWTPEQYQGAEAGMKTKRYGEVYPTEKTPVDTERFIDIRGRMLRGEAEGDKYRYAKQEEVEWYEWKKKQNLDLFKFLGVGVDTTETQPTTKTKKVAKKKQTAQEEIAELKEELGVE